MRDRMQRFAIYMSKKGLNDNQVTRDCNLSVGLIGQARTGKSDLGSKTIDKILRVYQDLNKVWLLTGEGEMLNTSSVPPSAKLSSETSCVSESAICAKFIALLEKKDEQIDRLLSLLEKLR